MQSFKYGEASSERIEFQWYEGISKRRKTSYGTAGWARIFRRSGGVKDEPPTLCRLHVCADDPCTARWPAGKYGHNPKPIHVQLLEWTADLEAELEGGAHSTGSLAPLAPSEVHATLPAGQDTDSQTLA